MNEAERVRSLLTIIDGQAYGKTHVIEWFNKQIGADVPSILNPEGLDPEKLKAYWRECIRIVKEDY